MIIFVMVLVLWNGQENRKFLNIYIHHIGLRLITINPNKP